MVVLEETGRGGVRLEMEARATVLGVKRKRKPLQAFKQRSHKIQFTFSKRSLQAAR